MSERIDWKALAAEVLGPCNTCGGSRVMHVDCCELDGPACSEPNECIECAEYRDAEIDRIAPILERIVTSGLAYTIGRRDGLAVRAHREVVIGDRVHRFLSAYHAWVTQPGDGAAESRERCDAWAALGWMPGLSEGE